MTVVGAQIVCTLVLATALGAQAPHYTAADVQFMQGMISHHAQAITMAGWAPSHGASDNVRVLCARIAVSQRDEIRSMQRWLGDHHEMVPDSLGRMPGMASMPGMDMGSAQPHPGQPTSGASPSAAGDASTGRGAALMPGMLSGDQMAELDQAKGPDFDKLFLVYMIQHHEGALTMVKQLMDSQGAAQDETVFKFASDVNADQTAEIDRMAKMLGAPQ
jgi:uncharacterized protein (DUF305 family)